MTKRVGLIQSPSDAVVVPGWNDYEFQQIERNFLTEGIVTGFAVSERGAGANMSVDVALGRALIEITNTNVTHGKTYKVWFDSDATENIVVTTADPTNPRIDRLVLRVDVATDPNGNASNVAIIELLAGTPAGSPSAPAEPSNAITLATVSVPASDTTIGNAQITDARTYAKLADTILGNITRQGLLNGVVASSGTDTITATFDPALSALTNGYTVIIIPANNNTGAATFAPNGLTAKAIRKLGNTALAANDIKANFPAVLTYNSTDDNWKLQNPANSQASVTPLVLTGRNGAPSTVFGCATAANFTQTATIAYDAVSTYSSGAPATSHTVSHTCTGSNRLLLAGFYHSGSSADDCTGVTYAGVAMTRIATATVGTERAYIYGLIAPSTGANNIVMSYGASRSVEGVNTSYTGASQDFLPDATTSATATAATTVTVNTTTVNDNSWVAAFMRNNIANFGSYTGTARGGARNNNMVDNNAAKTPAGAVTLTGNWSGSGFGIIVTCSFAPAQTGPTLSVFDFDQTTREHAEWTSVLPSGYSGGTITAKLHWVSSSGTGNVVWGVQARALADQDDSASLFGTAQTVTDTKVASKVHITSATSAITIGGSPVAGQLVAFRAYRDAGNASDTLTADARLVAVEITY